jgi:hypothetical protein
LRAAIVFSESSEKEPAGLVERVISTPAQSRVQQYLARQRFELLLARPFSQALKDSPMYILRALVFSFLAQVVLAGQPTPMLPDPKLTPGNTFDVTAQDVCVPGYAKKVRAVPAWLERQRTPSSRSIARDSRSPSGRVKRLQYGRMLLGLQNLN